MKETVYTPHGSTTRGFVHLYVVMVVLVMAGVISSLMKSTYTEHDIALQAERSTLANTAADSARECIMYWQLEATDPVSQRFNPNGPEATVSCSVSTTDTHSVTVGNKFFGSPYCLGSIDAMSYEYPPIQVGPFSNNSCAKAAVVVTQDLLADTSGSICLYRLEITGYDDCTNPTVERTFVTTF